MEHIVSFSGGKNSTAMLLRMLEKKDRVDRIVFADTGFQLPETYEFIEKVEDYTGRSIERVKGENADWDKWFYGKVKSGEFEGKMRGFPLTLFPCWFSRQAKLRPLEKICKGNIRYIGISTDEKHRAKDKKDTFYPLIEWGWSDKDCLRYLRKKEMLNPIYKRFSRSGCWICPKQSKSSLRALCRYYPRLWSKLKEYVKDDPKGFRHNLTVIEREVLEQELLVEKEADK